MLRYTKLEEMKKDGWKETAEHFGSSEIYKKGNERALVTDENGEISDIFFYKI